MEAFRLREVRCAYLMTVVGWGWLPPVLEPCLDLCVSEAESPGQGAPLLHTQVFVLLEGSLQQLQLTVREGCPEQQRMGVSRGHP